MREDSSLANIQVLAIDLDGTLLDSQSCVSEQNGAALDLAKSAGLTIALATGKPYAAIAEHVHSYSLHNPHIVLGGGLIVQATDETVLWQQGLLSAEAVRIIEGLSQLKMPFVVYYQKHSAVLSDFSMSGRIAHLVDIGEPSPLVCSVMTSEETAYKVLTFTHVEETEQDVAVRAMASEDTQVIRTSPYLLEFIPRHGGKHIALEQLAQQKGITLANIAAFGDSENDRDMLHAAGWSVVMGNASQSLQAIANWVVADNDNHGVAEAIMRIVQAQKQGGLL